MKVYSVVQHVQYEGSDLLGVFGSREEALVFAKSKESPYWDVGIVESELGQPVDLYESVEWVQ